MSENINKRLWEATEQCSEGEIRLCIREGANVNVRGIFFKTPLHLAAENDSPRCCLILLEAGAEVDAKVQSGWTPLHKAIANADVKCFKVLVNAGADIRAKDNVGTTPLHRAAVNDAFECCRFLLNAGVEAYSTDNMSGSPLHMAARFNSAKCCRMFLDAGVPVDTTDLHGMNPLHLAATFDSAPCCQMLVDAGAAVNLPDGYFGKTPLHYAASNNAETCCQILVDAGAEVNATDKAGCTPLHLVNTAPEKCSKILLDAGANANALNSDGESPLHKACKIYNDTGKEKFYALIATLLRAGSDITVRNKNDLTPADYFSSEPIREQLEKDCDNFSTLHQLTASGSEPVDVVKVFLCGDPAVGKTTIKNTLTKKLSVISKLKELFVGSEKDDDYERTPGIDVSRHSIEDVGDFLVWDCAGQIEYSMTHGMFMGSAQSVFVVLYDLMELMAGNTSTSKFWLPLIKATRELDEVPKVILVATHIDKVQDQRRGSLAAKRLLKWSTEMFSNILDIDSELILLDTRDKNSEGMERMKLALKRAREEIIGEKKLPTLCSEVQKIMKPWSEEPLPVIDWIEYLLRTKDSYKEVDERTLGAVTTVLHNIGHVYWARFMSKEDQLILNTRWFTTEIIGMAFAGDEFAGQLQTLLPNQTFYTLDELQEFFTDKMDTTQLLSLLNHMDLVHETEDGMFLLPGKLPLHGKEVTWNAKDAYAVKGITIACADEIDIFNPSVFPCLQKKILDAYKGATLISRNAIRCTLNKVDLFIQLTKHKEAINLAVMCQDENSVEAAYTCLKQTIGLLNG